MNVSSPWPGVQRSTLSRYGGTGFLLVSLVSVLLAGTCFGQSADEQAALNERQAALGAQIQQLRTRMTQLAAFLAETEPGQAERLRDAIALINEQRLELRSKEVAELLAAQRFGDAEHAQAKLAADLQRVLETLTTIGGDLDRLREEREALEAFRKQLAELRAAQSEARERAARSAARAAQADALQASAAALRALADEQQALREAETESGRTAETQAAQRELAARATDRAEALATEAQSAESLEQAAALERAAEAAGDAHEAMQTAAASESAGPDERADAGSNDSSKPTEPAEIAAEQAAAEASLRRAADELEVEAERLTEQADIRKIARLQRDLEEQAAQIRGAMEPGVAGKRPTPGQNSLERAGEPMRAAAESLEEDAPEAGAAEQEKALRELDRALDELDDALRQVRREEREEVLAALETRLKAVLAQEQAVQAALEEIGDAPAATWGLATEQSFGAAMETHASATEEAGRVHRLLIDEGTSVVVPELLGQVVREMQRVRLALQQRRTTAATRRQLSAIIAELKALIAAIEVQRAAEQQQPSGSGQSGVSDELPPLMPNSAELKLLRSAQQRINDQTTALAEAQDAPESESAGLAERQGALADLTRRILERSDR